MVLQMTQTQSMEGYQIYGEERSLKYLFDGLKAFARAQRGVFCIHSSVFRTSLPQKGPIPAQ